MVPEVGPKVELPRRPRGAPATTRVGPGDDPGNDLGGGPGNDLGGGTVAPSRHEAGTLRDGSRLALTASPSTSAARNMSLMGGSVKERRMWWAPSPSRE